MVLFPIFDLQKVDQGHELKRRRMSRWIAFCGLKDGEKLWIYLEPLSTGPPTRHTHGHTHTRTHTHTPTIAIGENATRCILPKNRELCYDSTALVRSQRTCFKPR